MTVTLTGADRRGSAQTREAAADDHDIFPAHH
jgi:hypothetical protein